MGVLLAIIGVIASALLGGSIPLVPTTTNPSNNQQIGQESCMPRLNKNRLLKVDIDPEVENMYATNTNPIGGNKENKTWVLVKENAQIPSWKVDLYRRTGNGRTHEFAEMEKIGLSIPLDNATTNQDIGKEVYIGTGWCNPLTGLSISEDPNWPDTPCTDPLVQDTLFIAIKKGMTYEELNQQDSPIYCDVEYCEKGPNEAICQSNNGILRNHFTACMDWGEGKRSEPPRTLANLQQYYWTFNVYYDVSKLPANASVDDLPCWMKLQCPNGGDVMGAKRKDAKNQSNCETNTGDVLAAIDPPDRPRLLIGKNEIIINRPLPPDITLADHYLSVAKLTQRPVADAQTSLIGTAYQSKSTGTPYFNVWVKRETATDTTTHLLILDPINHEGPWWSFAPTTSKSIANTLQLGTFIPGIPSFFYEWWTPSCKPALYFYPPKETEISVKVKPNGYLTQSIPEHGKDGWRIKAYPDGTLVNNVTRYPYLYYEAAVKNVAIPKENGWLVQSDHLISFFHSVLPKLGLNEKEINDFKEYWIPKLNTEESSWHITLIGREELDRIEPVEISPKPDNFIRVRFYFEKINQNEIVNNSLPIITNYYPLPIAKPRSGFVAVDWGGIIANGSCGTEEVSR